MNKVKNYIRPVTKCFHDFDKFYLLSGSPSEAQYYSQEGSGQQLAKELPLTSFVMRKKMVKTFGVIRPLISSL